MSSNDSRVRTLLLVLRYPHLVSYYDDWFDALNADQHFVVDNLNILNLTPRQLEDRIETYDVVILLHSCTADTTNVLARFADVLGARRRAVLMAFVGNEYNSPYARLSEKRKILRECRPDLIATQLLLEAGEYLYTDCTDNIISLPHALNPDVFKPDWSYECCKIDIGVRSFRYSPLLGDDDRNSLIAYFLDRGKEFGLTVDISQSRRFGRENWARFLASSRGTVSTEAGSWYLERDDAFVMRIYEWASKKRVGIVISEQNPLRRLSRRLPVRAKAALAALLRMGPVKYDAFEDEKLEFSEIYNLFFKDAQKCQVYSKAISSRHFDAIGTKTCQIMFPGRYNDILKANEHYISLAPDFSNIDDVMWRFRDRDEVERIVNSAYEHIMSGHTYRHRTRDLYETLMSLS